MNLSPRSIMMIVGAVVGAAIGALAAYAYVESEANGGLWKKERHEGHELMVKAGPMDIFKIGTTFYALVRQIMGLVKPQ